MSYLVEVRLEFEVEASAVGEALRSVSAAVHSRNAINIEYLVRQGHEVASPATSFLENDHGLDRLAYTVAEVASILGNTRSSIYKLVRRGIKAIRMSRPVLIPRGSVAAILNDDYQHSLCIMREIIAGVRNPGPAYQADCKSCAWYSTCMAQLERMDDLTLRPAWGKARESFCFHT